MGEAQLQIQVGPDGKQAKVYSKQYLGRWALFRLLEDAQVERRQSGYRMTWRFDVESGPPIDVHIDFRSSRTQDPFAPGFFTNFRLPAELGRSPA
jgi:type VI protein secretion system component VasK